MNTGAEGVETALKLARKWGYKKKKIPKDEVNKFVFFVVCIVICYYKLKAIFATFCVKN